MRAIFIQFSGLIGLFVFLSEMWHYAPVEKTIVAGISTGLIAYLAFIVGELTIRRILEYTPPGLAGEGAASKGTDAPAPEVAERPASSNAQ